MFLSAGLQNGVNAYILPAAGCDLQLSSEEKGFLNVAFLVGQYLFNFSKMYTEKK